MNTLKKQDCERQRINSSHFRDNCCSFGLVWTLFLSRAIIYMSNLVLFKNAFGICKHLIFHICTSFYNLSYSWALIGLAIFRDDYIMTLQDLPILILENIIDYLWYDELISLSRTNKYFKEKVSNQVIECSQLPQPSIEKLSRKQLRKPILRLEIRSELDDYNYGSRSVEDFIQRLLIHLRAVNLTRVGDLSLWINLKPTQEWNQIIG